MKRLISALCIALFSIFPYRSEAVTWDEYKRKYLREPGYIIDPYNNNRVTSEAQGYGMIIALKNADRQTFEKIYRWTKLSLQREDKLFSWHWNERVIDYNNATDGDLLIAYALLMASKKWKDAYYYKEFQEINRSLKRLIVGISNSKGQTDTILLPAVYGFSNEKYEITIYPSYYIDFILKELSAEDQDWRQVHSYIEKLYSIKNLTTQVKYSLVDKYLYTNQYADLDVYRVILYSYLAGRNLSALKESFKSVDMFFNRNSYIPFTYVYTQINQEKNESPFCIYRLFYVLYGNPKYLERYKAMKEVDNQNYFCDSIELLME